jgi:tetratricopeptide (TPR) repeat protein
LAEEDIEAILAYTNKCIELYAEQAKKMQDNLSDFPEGEKDQIFSYWALNDVATALFIQGEAFRKAGMNDEAKQAYHRIVDEFKYGQCWDTKGWFWKPSEAAAEKLAMIDSGSSVDFGDYTSSTLTSKAWTALSSEDLEAVKTYAGKTLELYSDKAQEMQNSLTEYPWETKEKIFSYWALNDVGTSLFILGEANRKSGNIEEAKRYYKNLIDDYYYAQCWDPNGWFWKPAEAAQQKLDEIGGV